MYHGDKEDSLVKLSEGLKTLGWSIYGFHEDKSDMMVDYYHPARWDGIAVKNGYILVVDCYRDGEIGGDFIQRSYDPKIAKKIKKLQALANCPSATQGERDNALSQINKFDKKLVEEITIITDLPKVTYQKNPPHAVWHIERDGNIIAKGNGVFSFSNINTWREEKLIFDKEENNYMELLRNYWNIDNWDTFISYRKKEKEEKKKLLDKYFNILSKWDNLVQIKLGEGEENKLVKKIIEEEVIYYLQKPSDIPTEYLMLNKKSTMSGISQNDVFKIYDNFNVKKVSRDYIDSKEDGNFYSYKLEPRKNTKFANVFINEEKINKGVWVYVELVKKVKLISKEIWVKDTPKKQNKETKNKAIEAENSELVLNEEFLDYFKSGEIKDFKRTDNQEIEKVLVIKENINDFKSFNLYLKKNKLGYYSKFAGGFILKEDGIKLLNIDNKKNRNIHDEVKHWFTQLRVSLAMDALLNEDVLISFIVEDVLSSADNEQYSDIDFTIPLRRWMESNLN
jgi:hypothetical protein